MAFDSIGIRESNRNQYANNSTAKKDETVITVTMKGTTPEAHADAILRHFGMSKADEQAFKEKFGYDLRQFLTNSFAKSDNRAAHQAIGGGYFKVQIPVSKELMSQIRAVKTAPQPVPTPTPTPTANPNETIAGRTGIDQSSQIRSELQNKLPVPQPVPTPVPTGTPTPIANTNGVGGKDVSQMGMAEKLQIVFGKAIEHLGPEAAEKFKQLLSPENIAIMVGTTAALIAVQGVPVLDVIVDVAVLGLAAYSLGSEALSVMGDLVNFATKTAGAKTEADLDAAAQSLARATATIGVDALAAILIHKGVKSIKGGELPPPNTRVVEMVTPEGVRVRVRVPIEEPANPKGSNILESRRTPQELAADIALRAERADKYAELVKSNKPWRWSEIAESLTDTEKAEIKKLAVEKGLIPKIEVDPATGFADFSGYVIREVQLPRELWNKSDKVQFAWLDKQIGGRPKGYTWHHHQDPGRMQLVEFGVHNITNHNGGRSVWATGKR